ncbi:MAG: glycosyl transferase family 1 [Halochromatium sp.]|nr:glycosyl transferase family 1 [Halochromatium sp.]
MRIAVFWKRHYMGQDVISDRYARLYELPRGLAELGHEVRVFCLSYRSAGRIQRDDPVAGTTGSLIWKGYDAGPLWVGGLLAYWRATRRELLCFNPDVLLGGSDAPHVVLMHHLGRRFDRPYVIDLYDNFESFGLTRLPGMRQRYRRALRGAAGITAVSEPFADALRQGLSDVPVTTLESTIDPERFQPCDGASARARLGLPAQARIVGISGSLSPNRGIERIYRVFVRLLEQDSSLQLVLAGDLHRRAPPPNHPRVRFLGRLPHGAMADFFSALDLALVPMIDTDFGRYAFPQKAYEILACGTPLLTARIGALARTLAPWPACLYTPEDEEDLERQIKQQLRHPVRPRLMIPSWSDQAGQLSLLLQKSVNYGKPGGVSTPELLS